MEGDPQLHLAASLPPSLSERASDLELSQMMEAAAICPPKLEEAGLEDCALPPEAIKEAFLKAAHFLKSRIVGYGDEDEDGSCVEDPGPSNGEARDALLGTGELPRKPLCSGVREKGSFPAGEEPWVADDVVVVGAEGGVPTDEVVVLGGEEAAEGSAEGGKKAWVGDDVHKGGKEKKNGGEDEDGGNGEETVPTLTEVLI